MPTVEELRKAKGERLDRAYLRWVEGQPAFAKNSETAKSYSQVNRVVAE